MVNKCSHDKNKYKCKICNPKAYCEHNKYKYNCLECNPERREKRKQEKRTLCEHNKRKDACVLCSGCVHKKLICIECTPDAFCEHKKRKTICVECEGGAICKHKKIRSVCKECDGGSFCLHGKLRSICVECDGGSVCKHKKIKYFCIECDGSQICSHNKIKKSCKECDGTDFCIHNKRKYFCLDCNGAGICSHKIRKYDCKICRPDYYLVGLQRTRLRYVLEKMGKTKNTIDYLGCSPLEFYEYIKLKMTDEMKLENIHIDHIKPVSKFNLNDINEVYECCHWSNLQPLLIKDNLEKSNKWTEEDEINWRKNIIKFIRE